MPTETISYCPCGNLSVDGLNFTKLDSGDLECAACGSTKAILFLPADRLKEVERQRDEAVEGCRRVEAERESARHGEDEFKAQLDGATALLAHFRDERATLTDRAQKAEAAILAKEEERCDALEEVRKAGAALAERDKQVREAADAHLAQLRAEGRIDCQPTPELLGEEERRFTVAEIRNLLSLQDVVVAFARARWEQLRRAESFDDLSFVRNNELKRNAARDLEVLAGVLAIQPVSESPGNSGVGDSRRFMPEVRGDSGGVHDYLSTACRCSCHRADPEVPRCGGKPGSPRPVDRGPGPDGMGRLPWKLCEGCPDCRENTPPDPQGAVVELLAKRLFEEGRPFGPSWEAAHPSSRQPRIDRARGHIAAITPLLHDQWRSERVGKLVEERESMRSSIEREVLGELRGQLMDRLKRAEDSFERYTSQKSGGTELAKEIPGLGMALMYIGDVPARSSYALEVREQLEKTALRLDCDCPAKSDERLDQHAEECPFGVAARLIASLDQEECDCDPDYHIAADCCADGCRQFRAALDKEDSDGVH